MTGRTLQNTRPKRRKPFRTYHSGITPPLPGGGEESTSFRENREVPDTPGALSDSCYQRAPLSLLVQCHFSYHSGCINLFKYSVFFEIRGSLQNAEKKAYPDMREKGCPFSLLITLFPTNTSSGNYLIRKMTPQCLILKKHTKQTAKTLPRGGRRRRGAVHEQALEALRPSA